MPRASWKGYLRLSLVSCPIYLSPATTREKAVKLHQVWRQRTASSYAAPAEEFEDEPDYEPPRRGSRPIPAPVEAEIEPEPIGPASRIALRPHDRQTGREVEREDVVKGYEYDRGQFVTFTAEELKALDIESSKQIDLTSFVPRAEVDPIYFSTPYYIYPDGLMAAQALRVIVAAMAEAGMAGLGRLTLSRRERMVLVEPRGAGMVLMTLRSATEVRAAQFDAPTGDLDAEMVAIATMIIKRRAGNFDPASFQDRYQAALREMIEAKLKGLPVRARPAPQPAAVVDLMAALKRSLAEEKGSRPAKPKRVKDRRQGHLLLPVAGKAQRRASLAKPAAKSRRKKA